MKNLDKYRGCLIGGAAGDALGYAVEFLSEDAIFNKYGKNGITEYKLINGVAQISDDTQMTLFTANGLLIGTTRGMTRGIMDSYPSYISNCYKDWFRTQTEKFLLNTETTYSWLVNIPELFALRAPGNTCLSAINASLNGAVTGNILGAYLGLSNIPQKYRDNLEMYDVILEIADDLYNDCKMSEYSSYRDEVWERKYLCHTYAL